MGECRRPGRDGPRECGAGDGVQEEVAGQVGGGQKLRDDPVLDNLEEASQEAKQKLSTSGGSSNLSNSIGPDSESETTFRQRSQQSWRKQHQELVDEASHIGEKKDADLGATGGSLGSSLAEKLLQRGYGLGSSQLKADARQSSVVATNTTKDEGRR